MGWHAKFFGVVRLLTQHPPKDMGDDVSGPLYGDQVSHAYVFAVHIFLVVQRRVLHGGTITNTGFKMAYGFRLPVRPTLMPISNSRVVACSAGNL